MKRILVPLDRSELAERALDVAVPLAARHGATLRLVHVWPAELRKVGAPPTVMAGALEDHRDTAWYLEKCATELRARAAVPVETVLLDPPVAPAICREARDAGADLIVMSTHGRTGWSRLWIGSVADTIVRTAETPVLLVRAREDGGASAARLERILVPLDGSANAERILHVVAKIFDDTMVQLRLLRVVQQVRTVTVMPEGGIPVADVDEGATREAAAYAEQYLAQVAARLRTELPYAEVESTMLVRDAVARAVVDAAHDVDLVAMMPRRHGAGRMLLGSVTDKVLRGTHASLLVMHPVPGEHGASYGESTPR
jgi:nucleotide-binding universal stress UspA family protein